MAFPKCPTPSSTFHPHARRTSTATRCCSWRRPKHCASPRPACSWTCCDARRAAPARHKTDCPAVGCRTAGPVPATWTVRGEAGAEAAVTKVCDIPDVNIAVEGSNVASTVPVVLVVRRAARHGLLTLDARLPRARAASEPTAIHDDFHGSSPLAPQSFELRTRGQLKREEEPSRRDASGSEFAYDLLRLVGFFDLRDSH